MPIAGLVADANVVLSHAHALALARTMNLPLWSNDRDLQVPPVHCYTTAALLKALDS